MIRVPSLIHYTTTHSIKKIKPFKFSKGFKLLSIDFNCYTPKLKYNYSTMSGVQKKLHFASDNYFGVHEKVLQKLQEKNSEIPYAVSYQDGTDIVEEIMKKHIFKNDRLIVWMVGIGTAANVLGIRTCLRSNYESVLCADMSHIRHHEINCMELISGGAQVLDFTIDPKNGGKLSVSQIEDFLKDERDFHCSKPRVLSITSPTEFGAIYTLDEIKEFNRICRKHDMFLHMDGARFANAIDKMGGLEIAAEIGKYIDVLSFGGTKNGMMGAEAIVFMNHEGHTPFHLDEFERVRKQGMQLFSKTRFLTYQFEALLEDDLWLALGKKSNDKALHIAKSIEALNSELVALNSIVETNQIFLRMDKRIVKDLLEEYFFYIWTELDEKTDLIRLVTSSEIPDSVISEFLEKLQVSVQKYT